MNNITYSKRKLGGYYVLLNGNIIGSVERIAQWTVRGDWIYWNASYKNKSVALNCATRKEAVAALVAHLNSKTKT